MLKFILIPLLVLTFAASSMAGWFTHEEDHRHEQQLQYELNQERQQNGNLGAGIVVLGVGCVLTLVIGTMIGSRTRRASNDK
jgi:lysylphosphatidylglycerol synthetase-like protein (DUF2156 family)